MKHLKYLGLGLLILAGTIAVILYMTSIVYAVAYGHYIAAGILSTPLAIVVSYAIGYELLVDSVMDYDFGNPEWDDEDDDL